MTSRIKKAFLYFVFTFFVFLGVGSVFALEKKDTKPVSVKSGYFWFKDSDDVRETRVFTQVLYELNKNHTLTYRFARKKFQESNFRDANENSHHFAYRFGEEWKYFQLAYTYRDFFNLKDSHNYDFQALFPLWKFDSIHLRHGLKHVDTTRALQAKVRYYLNSIGLSQNLGKHFLLNIFYEKDVYRDGNTRNILKNGLFYKPFEKVNFKFGYENVFYDTSESNSKYWTPNRLRINQAKMSFIEHLFKDQLNLTFIYAVGKAQEVGQDDQISHTGIVDATWEIRESLKFFTYFDLSETPTYDSRTFMAGFHIDF